jgi:hypothetical protein
MNITGTLTTGYVAEVGETPQTAGDLSPWFGIEKGKRLTLTLAGSFGSTTVIRLQSTNSPVGGAPTKVVASLATAATTIYRAELEDTWYRVYFYTQDGSEELTYTLAETPEGVATLGYVADTVTGTVYSVTIESGSVTPVEV